MLKTEFRILLKVANLELDFIYMMFGLVVAHNDLLQKHHIYREFFIQSNSVKTYQEKEFLITIY